MILNNPNDIVREVQRQNAVRRRQTMRGLGYCDPYQVSGLGRVQYPSPLGNIFSSAWKKVKGAVRGAVAVATGGSSEVAIKVAELARKKKKAGQPLTAAETQALAQDEMQAQVDAANASSANMKRYMIYGGAALGAAAVGYGIYRMMSGGRRRRR